MLPRFASTLCAAVALLFPAAAQEEEAAWNLERTRQEFKHTTAAESCVCLVLDSWNIALISHNKRDIGAVFITAREDEEKHLYDLRTTARRLSNLVGLKSPLYQKLEESGTEAAVILDGELMDDLGSEAEHVLHSTPLAGIAYLLNEEYFYIAGITPQGFLHWKTIKKSNVELLMPLAPAKLQAIEVTGRQRIDEFAAEVLARKLGFGSNTAMLGDREVICQRQKLDKVPYMNTKAGVIVAKRGKRVTFGKRKAAVSLINNRHSDSLTYPDKTSYWPVRKKPEPKPEPAVVEEVKPLTPDEARKAYAEYLRALKK